MVFKDVPIKGSDALILGFSFKENCPDFRNTKVVDIYNDLISYGLIVDIYDPWVDKKKYLNNTKYHYYLKSIKGKNMMLLF